ncbi:hypothetical protein Moror_868 [Moniliophthora roreri MCA 2997]|uniref:Uncharacterized protein n=1 Tax=Moniliophthora roreri (strain MCA 2997) TaxID=1381753 RepID=V2XBF4_MONRO|nr:hypothetical protein Moror_868 [Moniliophthora roreri MCA 2997]
MTVLIKDGTLFFYPACLIEPGKNLKSWTIKWWCLNQPAKDVTHIPGSYAAVEVSCIVDSLYHDAKGRRIIQLGRWTTIAEIDQSEYDGSEKQEDPWLSLPYTKEIDENTQLDGLDENEHPFAAWRLKQHVHVVVPGIKEVAPSWVVNSVLQHAFMLWIEHRDKKEFESHSSFPAGTKEHAHFIQQQAWARLVEYTGCAEDGGPLPLKFDIDQDLLARLEDKMFDMSKEAGPAGNWQWGLDVECHQDDWHPNTFFIVKWSDQYVGDNDELLMGPNYILDEYTKKCDNWKAENECLKALAPKPQHSKPIPIAKSKAKSSK